jgi:hypothetical protein
MARSQPVFSPSFERRRVAIHRGERGRQRRAVAIPHERERPTRIHFTRIRFARAVKIHGVRQRLLLQRGCERMGMLELRRAERGDAPLGAVGMLGHVGRLAAQRQHHAVALEDGFHLLGDG